MKASASIAIALGIMIVLAAALSPMEFVLKIFVGLIGFVFAAAGYMNKR